MIRHCFQQHLVTEAWMSRTHPKTLCWNDDACVIHKPSRHRLMMAPMHAFVAPGIPGVVVARYCKHGNLHHDPDSKRYTLDFDRVYVQSRCEETCMCGCCDPLHLPEFMRVLLTVRELSFIEPEAY